MISRDSRSDGSEASEAEPRPLERIPEVYEGSPLEMWRAARALSDEPHLEWMYPILAGRFLASQPLGFDIAYEELQSWEQVVGVHRQVQLLSEYLPHDFLRRSMTLGVRVHDSFLRSRDGKFDRPALSEPFRGRHAVSVVGLTGTENSVVIANTWGSRWGRDGLGFMTRRYFEAHVDSIFLDYPAWIGFSPRMDEPLQRLEWLYRKASDLPKSALAQAYATPNRAMAKTIRRGRTRLQLRLRRLYSVASGDLLELFELRDADGQFLGRAHLLHDSPTRTGIITEFWILPTQRARGYGALLEGEVLERAKGDAGLDQVRLVLHEADSTEVGSRRARSFAEDCGYEWEGVKQQRPPITDFARKKIR